MKKNNPNEWILHSKFVDFHSQKCVKMLLCHCVPIIHCVHTKHMPSDHKIVVWIFWLLYSLAHIECSIPQSTRVLTRREFSSFLHGMVSWWFPSDRGSSNSHHSKAEIITIGDNVDAAMGNSNRSRWIAPNVCCNYLTQISNGCVAAAAYICASVF